MNIVKKGLTGYQLKVLAIIFMAFDHINMYFGELLHWPLWFSFIGRFVAPTFCFLLVEGYFHTHSKKKYLERLLLGAAITGAGNIIYNLLTKSYINSYTHQIDYFAFLGPHNIFLTLAMQLIVMWLLDNIIENKHRFLSIVPLVISAFLMMMFEGGVYLLPLAIIFFLGEKYHHQTAMLSAALAWCILLLVKALMTYFGEPAGMESLYHYLTFDNEFMMIAVVPLIWLYNGLRGGNGSKAEKNFFYYFYPIHLWLIYLIRALV